MKFGKLENIEDVDFSLPVDHDTNNDFFDSNTNSNSTLYSGATSWINSNWKGIIYSEKIKKSDFLSQYSKQFNSIELNATHYRTPEDKTIDTWKNETPDDFRFCPKILQAISHRKDMVANKELFDRFCIQISKLEEKLGCCFLQLPPYFKEANLPYLEKFLQKWPSDLRIAVELRNEEMHKENDQFNRYLELLTKYNASPLITDVAGRRDIIHMVLNTDVVFVRWVGNALHSSDYTRIKEWVKRLDIWSQNGANDIYFHLHEPENEKTPQIASYLATELRNIQYITHRGPKILEEPPNLFS